MPRPRVKVVGAYALAGLFVVSALLIGGWIWYRIFAHVF